MGRVGAPDATMVMREGGVTATGCLVVHGQGLPGPPPRFAPAGEPQRGSGFDVRVCSSDRAARAQVASPAVLVPHRAVLQSGLPSLTVTTGPASGLPHLLSPGGASRRPAQETRVVRHPRCPALGGSSGRTGPPPCGRVSSHEIEHATIWPGFFPFRSNHFCSGPEPLVARAPN